MSAKPSPVTLALSTGAERSRAKSTEATLTGAKSTGAKPILVTGSHRSGSTWVGRMIAASPAVAYIHEPFHLNHNRGFCGASFDHWFAYICAENEARYFHYFQKTTQFRYHVDWDWELLRNPEKREQVIKDYQFFQKKRAAGCSPLLKDPIALFSAEWLANRFNMDVVVMIRHPAAFAHSLKKAGWFHNFSHFLDQPLLMRDYLYPFEAEMREFIQQPRDIIQHAALLWKLIHYMIGSYRERYPSWIFVRHEDLSFDPTAGFREIFDRLQLEFGDRVQSKIEDYSSAKNQTDSPPSLHSIKRDSKANIATWKTALTAAEIDYIRQQVKDISSQFYSDAEW